MSRTVTFFVPGVPVAKGRPRFANGHTYTPAKTKAAETNILLCYMAVEDRPTAPWEGPVTVAIGATFPWPKTTPKWKLQYDGSVPHTGRPDADNLLKTIDALNGVAWRDDSQCYYVTVKKRYGTVPGVNYHIEFMDSVTREAEEA